MLHEHLDVGPLDQEAARPARAGRARSTARARAAARSATGTASAARRGCSPRSRRAATSPPAPTGASSPAAPARSRRSGTAARRTPSRRCRCPARRRRTRRRPRCGSTATPRRPPRRRSARRRCRAPAGAPAPRRAATSVREQPVQLEVPRLERVVRRHGQVRQLPDLAVDDRRRDAAVVEQRGVGGEPLLAHQLLVAQRAVVVAERGVPLRRDLADLAVVRHHASDNRTLSSAMCVVARVTPCRATSHTSSTRPGCGWSTTPPIFPPGNAPLDDAAAAHLERRDAWYAGFVGSLVVRDTDLPQVRGARRRPRGRGHRRRRPARRAARAGAPHRAVRERRVEIALRDLDDPAGNARRVVAAVDAARAEGVLDDATTVHVELPATEPVRRLAGRRRRGRGGRAPAEATAPAAPTPPPSRPRRRSRSGSTPPSTGRRRSSAPPGCTRRSGTATPRPASSTTASSTCWSPPSSSSTAAPSPRPPRRSTSTTRRS